ncbi:hypothetical protein HYO65_gp022 [Tenacibaculum phage PTm1]|uniref:Uncharacterized protein n=2 Tax=Shirahamavirus PTm1 TaxID=2846435 RepID=A0A5S9C0Y7_9CAUD|nr:hypothetical protein HYO65_gp022 [Tenacibaculum phage PTm1]BBI90414.1 hypothetical protein [Tenacibaculum phage PTm1]BBI90722.1 hypothetical protein [Tenacibaculum phage PTm5]
MDNKNQEKNMLDTLAQRDAGINTNKVDTFIGWHDVKREDLPYGGLFFPKSYNFQVQPANAETVAHYSSMDETNPLSVQSALTHVIKKHIRITDNGEVVNSLDVIHESMRFWFAMLVHTYTGNSTSLENSEMCPKCNHSNKVVITPYVIKFMELDDYVRERVDVNTGMFIQKTKSYGELEYQPITLGMRAELMAYMQEKYQKKESFDMQFLSYAPLIYPLRKKGQSIDDLYKNVYYPMTQDIKKFSTFTKIINKVALDQLLTIDTNCSKCDHRFQVDISKTQGLRHIFLDSSADDELL